MTQTVLEQLDQDIRTSRETVELGNALDRLVHNPDFKRVVAQGYLNQEAIRLVHLKADPAMQRPDTQAAIVRDIDAIGALASYFNVIRRHAAMAADQMNDAEEMRSQILDEGADV